jgi:ribosomal protein S18 acetylase RimI-like enzyme
MILNKEFLLRFDRNIMQKFAYLPSHIQSMEVRRTNHLLLIDSHLPCDMFNILCCHGLTDLASIHKAIKHFRSKKLPYAFWIGFEGEPAWLEAELQKLGLITDEMEWAMACDLKDVEISENRFEVRKVRNNEEIADLIQIMQKISPVSEHKAIESFYDRATSCLLSSDAQLTLLVGYDKAVPVSLASVFFSEGLASLFDVIVLPEMRGKGLGTRMTERGMLEAKESGVDACILTATNDVKYLYQKLGFKDVKTMKVYHENV